MAETNTTLFNTLRSLSLTAHQQPAVPSPQTTVSRLFKGHFVASYQPQRQISETIDHNSLSIFSLNPYRNLLNNVENEICEAENYPSSGSEKSVKGIGSYLTENKITAHQFKKDNTVIPWLSGWQTPFSLLTEAWVFPVTRQTGYPTGNHSTTQVLTTDPRHQTITIRSDRNPPQAHNGQPSPVSTDIQNPPLVPRSNKKSYTGQNKSFAHSFADQQPASNTVQALGQRLHSRLQLQENSRSDRSEISRKTHVTSTEKGARRDRPDRRWLIEETTKLVTLRHEEATKHPSRDTPRYQEIQQQLTHIVKTYRTHYEEEITHCLHGLQRTVTETLSNEGSATIEKLLQLKSELTSIKSEVNLFLNHDNKSLQASLRDQVVDALYRTSSKRDYQRLKTWITSNQAIFPNQLRPGDDLQLYFVFQELQQELDNQIAIYQRTKLSKENKEQTKENIAANTANIEKIINLYKTVFDRYQRFVTNQRYAHQVADMEETQRKGHRAIEEKTSPATQQRLNLIRTLNIPECNTDALLDMSEQDFHLVVKLLTGKSLTAEDGKTMQNNAWQLTAGNKWMVQRDHERVTVFAIGNSRMLVDTASNTLIGALDPIQMDRIHQRLQQEGHTGSGAITRQMVVDDFMNHPITEEQRRNQSGASLHNFLQIIPDEGAELIPQPGNNRPRDDQPIVPEIFRAQRRDFQR
ncbi:hypothetical protein [Endozoicomonas sp.]|uniref:hypothetical protein n=1 Tax=Endozoicomonas sp. TaxID=1892382 RepID=UPI0028836B76|nr:hypothetical protein [Endozoicomonas sp.]